MTSASVSSASTGGVVQRHGHGFTGGSLGRFQRRGPRGEVRSREGHGPDVTLAGVPRGGQVVVLQQDPAAGALGQRVLV